MNTGEMPVQGEVYPIVRIYCHIHSRNVIWPDVRGLSDWTISCDNLPDGTIVENGVLEVNLEVFGRAGPEETILEMKPIPENQNAVWPVQNPSGASVSEYTTTEYTVKIENTGDYTAGLTFKPTSRRR